MLSRAARRLHECPSVYVKLVARALSSQTSAAGLAEEIEDVVIVGGGMVGAALAALLARNPLTASMKVTLLDVKAQSFSWTPPLVPELRVSTLTPASIAMLKKAGAWEMLGPHSQAFSQMQVWDAGPHACIRWAAQDAGLQDMGVVAENSGIQASLLSAVHSSQEASQGLGQAAQGGTSTEREGNPGEGERRRGVGLRFLWPAAIKNIVLPQCSSTNSQGSTSNSTSSSTSSNGSTKSSTDGKSTGGIKEGGASGASHEFPEGPSIAGSQELQGYQKLQKFQGRQQGEGSWDDLAIVVLEGGQTIRTRLVVAADGSNSRVRQLAGLRTFGWDYGQRGLVATVECSEGLEGTAWQRFLPTGPLALLPVRGGLANIVWSTTPEVAKQLESLSPQEFGAVVNKALQSPFSSSSSSSSPPSSSSLAPSNPLSSLLAMVSSASSQFLSSAQSSYRRPPPVEKWVGSSPKSFPLQLKQSGSYVRPRLALIGDAAHAVHPLAGQGVNLGLGDAAQLASALAHARECGRDPGESMLLREMYEVPRQAATLKMSAALEGVQRVFGLQVPPLAAARGLGLSLLNAVGPVKNGLMRYAMGL